MTNASNKLYIPSLKNHIPRRGNALMRSFGRLGLRLTGWRFEGELPDLAKFIIIGAPHTSNWDFLYAMLAILSVDMRMSWMAKASLFYPPQGAVMRWLGGIGVDRSKSFGIVDQMVEEFEKRDQLVLGITPEGTRKKVDQWKTGFYHIAVGANIPILVVCLDYRNKVIGLGPLITPTGDKDKDIAEMRSFYDGAQAKIPTQF